MKIFVNGRATTIETVSCTIARLLELLGYQDHFVAVARNHVHIKRSEFTTISVREDDHIEILAPMAGG